METIALGHSDIGRVKPSNEDSFLIDKRMRVFVVADGMGGHAAGEVASATAVREIHARMKAGEAIVSHFVDTGEDRDDVLRLMEEVVRGAGKTIFDLAQREPEKRGMGTTVSMMLITPTYGFIAHVGDSRVYLVREGEVFQLTEDHSLINELIKRGRLRPEDAADAPYKNAVTRAVGVYEDVQVDTLDFEIAPGDNFLLCSDGLTNHVEDPAEIADIIGDEDFVAVPRHFVELANERGGKDNITSVVVRLDAEGEESNDIALKLNVLRQMPLFQHLTYVELVEVLNVSQVMELTAGETLFSEGDAGDHLFVVVEGQVRITKGGAELALLDPGAHFGEMAIMDKSPRSADATAETDARLIAVGRRPLFLLMRRDKDIAVKLLWCFVQVLNGRLRNTSADLRSALTVNVELQDVLGLEEIEDE